MYAPALALVQAFASVALGVQTLSVPLDSKACYLHVAASDSANPAPATPLSALGAMPGQSLRIVGKGDIDNGPSTDSVLSLLGVFSSSPVLLPPSAAHRVPGAIDAGDDFVTAPTFVGSETTDIPEDFRVATTAVPQIVVEIPAGATHLFLGIHDNQWFDNSDPDGDHGAEITVVGTWKDVGFALAGAAGLPKLAGSGLLLGGDPVAVELTQAKPSAPAFLIVGASAIHAPFSGGILVPAPDLVLGPFPTDPTGKLTLASTWPAGIPSLFSFWFQAWIQDPAAIHGLAASNGLKCLTP